MFSTYHSYINNNNNNNNNNKYNHKYYNYLRSPVTNNYKAITRRRQTTRSRQAQRQKKIAINNLIQICRQNRQTSYTGL